MMYPSPSSNWCGPTSPPLMSTSIRESCPMVPQAWSCNLGNVRGRNASGPDASGAESAQRVGAIDTEFDVLHSQTLL
jgi:hypothetical protein